MQVQTVIRILFVCLGNICRSPLAEGIFRSRATEMGLIEGPDGDFIADSAGTGNWHAGSPPDRRSIAVAARHHVDIRALRARQVRADDFEEFDYLIAMDRDNLQALEALCPDHRRDRLHLLMSFAKGTPISEVTDPYYFRDESGFERVYAVIEEGVEGLLTHLRPQR